MTGEEANIVWLRLLAPPEENQSLLIKTGEKTWINQRAPNGLGRLNAGVFRLQILELGGHATLSSPVKGVILLGSACLLG
jgi:hypothetical protein